MPTTPIDPITIRTIGGHMATISGIDPSDCQACLKGHVVSQAGIFEAGWNEFGIASNGNDRANIVVRDDEHIVRLLKAISEYRLKNQAKDSS
jgi:hypothetical protein